MFKKLFKKDPRKKYVLVANVLCTCDEKYGSYTKTYYGSIFLFENGYSSRKIESELPSGFNISDFKIYHNIILPWKNGVNFKLPTYDDIVTMKKQPYLYGR